MVHRLSALFVALLVAASLSLSLLGSWPANAASPSVQVNIKPSTHKVAYFSPTYPSCTSTPTPCTIRFTNQTSKVLTLYIWSALLATLKPNASVQHTFAYDPTVDTVDSHPTSQIEIGPLPSLIDCYIFVYQ